MRHMKMAVETELQREWLTYAEAQAVSGLSRTTIWSLVKSGDVEAARIGRALRINRESLNKYMKRSVVSPHAAV
jgi:excisionase family DNA binding protein